MIGPSNDTIKWKQFSPSKFTSLAENWHMVG